MINFLRHKDIDKRKWNRCIDKAKHSILYGYSWYLDIISPEWDALVEGDYEAVFPITWKRKYGLSYLSQPLFAQQLGVFSEQNLNQVKLKAFLNAIPYKFLHYDIMLNLSNLHKTHSKFKYESRKTYHLSLNNSYEQIAEKYSDDTKRNLKRSSKKNIILKTVMVEDVIELFKKNVWHKAPDVKLNDFPTLQELSKEVDRKATCIVVGAFDNRELGAGAIFYLCRNKIIFIFSASSEVGRKNGSMRLILDWVIRKYCNKKILLDFEGSSIESIENFFKSFGSEKMSFLNIKYSKFTLLESVIKHKQIINNRLASILLYS